MAAQLHFLDQRRLIDSNGIADGASIYFYVTGTTTLASIYADFDLTTPLANPVVVGAGAAVPTIYLDAATTYRRKIIYSDGTIDDLDPYAMPDIVGLAQTAQDAAEAARDTAIAAQDAAQTAADDAADARDDSIAAALGNNYYPGARSYVPRGMTSVAITAAGSGGTNGTYTCPLTGDNLTVDAYASVTVSGGAVTAVSVSAPGLYIGAAPTAGTVDTSAITGLTGATLTPTIGYLRTSGQYYLTDHASDSNQVALFQNQANAAVEVDASVDWLNFTSLQALADAAAASEASAASSASAAATSAGSIDATYYGSVQFPDFNGEEATAERMGEILLSGSKTVLVNGAALFNTAGAMGCIVDLDIEAYDCLNRAPMLLGTQALSSNTLTRTLNFRYYPDRFSTSAKQRTFEAYIRGESGATGFTVGSAVIPRTARGPFVPLFFYDGTNGQLDVYDIGTGTWYAGTPVAKPASWAGITVLTNDLVIGGAGGWQGHSAGAGYVFPRDNSAARQSTPQLRAAIRDVFITDVSLSHANIESFVNGGDLATIAGGAGNLRLHCPLATAGALASTVTTNRAGTITFTVNGTLRPGPTLKRQATATYLTLDRVPMPGFIARTAHADSAVWTMGGYLAGQTGQMYCKVVDTETGVTIIDTHRLFPDTTTVAGRWSAKLVFPGKWRKKWQAQVWFSGSPTTIAATHSRMQTGAQIQLLSQSEGEYAVGGNQTTTNGTGDCLVQPESDLATVHFARGTGLSGATTDSYWGTRSPATGNKLCGPGETLIGNRIRRVTDEPVMIIEQIVSGTSFGDLMDDTQSDRLWTDYATRQTYGACNRGPNGEIIVTGEVIIGWEAFYNAGGSVMADVYQPWIRGNGWPNTEVTSRDHWSGDGHMSFDPIRVIMPCNRKINGTSSLSDTDADTEADQRDDMRNWAHLLGYLIGPETTTHAMEGESGGVWGHTASVAITHPLANDWQGDLEISEALAESILMAMGKGTYPGPVFFESIEAGSAANKVIVRLGKPRQLPGKGLTLGATGYTGYSTASQDATVGGATMALHTKVSGGNARWGFEAKITSAGSWSVNNVTAASILSTDPSAVELTLSSNYVAGQTQIRHAPGGPGAYSTATVNQDDYRAGRLFFMGGQFVSGQPGRVGFAVAGSNQALTLA